MLDILEKYHADGLLYKQTHPTLDLTIWNYTPKVQFERLWDDITLQCRGLVTNSEGRVVARPFRKFFNYEELKPEDIPNEEFEVFEKMDGSLGILFNYKGEWIMATRGSFTSDQAIKAKEILDRYRSDKKVTYKNGLSKSVTFLFEIIYPENRIVIDYGEEKLVLLGAVYNGHPLPDGVYSSLKNGDEYTYRDLCGVIKFIGCEVVKKYDGYADYSLLKDTIKDDQEGRVIRFKSGLRMKIKGDEYCRLHRILTNISNRNIWEYLKDGKPLDDLLEKVPDEFYDWVKKTVSNLKYGYWRISEDAGKMHDYFRYGKYGDVYPEPSKKEFAEFVSKQPPIYRAVMFKMWDKKPYNDVIWKMLYPIKVEQPFKKLDDE